MAVTSTELLSTRRLAEQAFSRAAGAPLCAGNSVELLIDAQANFDAWLAAIGTAQRVILMENYIVRDDAVGRAFRDALSERASNGVAVRVIRDWLGCLGASSNAFWDPLRRAGGEVRTYNPPRFDSPFGWISRDHRKMFAMDGRVGFLSGVCLSERWLADADRGTDAWRDTGVCLRGPVIAELGLAFADVWDDLGDPLPDSLLTPAQAIEPAGDMHLRVIAARPQAAGVYRLDQLIASMARESLWLTDAYFVGVAPYVQALAAAVADDVDVRLLVPGSSDAPIVAALSRSDYRSLLNAGVRVFEWQGSMLHAKTAVADGRWARVGSSNLNLASWVGNCEIDVAVEDQHFAEAMQQQYLSDLENAVEVVLPQRRRRNRAKPRSQRRKRGGSASRTFTRAVNIAGTVGAALTNRRVLGSAESNVLLIGGAILSVLGIVGALFPRVIAWPLAILALWLALSLALQWWRLRKKVQSSRSTPPAE